MDRNEMSIQRMIIRSEVQPVVREELQPIMKQLFVVIDSLQLILNALKAMEKEIHGQKQITKVRDGATIPRKAKCNKAIVSKPDLSAISKAIHDPKEH